MFGFSKCYWWTSSEKDDRFNLCGECYSVFDKSGAEKAIKEVEEKYGIKRPNDIIFETMKD